MKAVIPAAGFGTRFLPFTKAVPKELVPVVKDGQNHFYATIEAATQAYNSANGPYTVLHDGTAPSGWKIDNITKVLTKIAKGLFFMAY